MTDAYDLKGNSMADYPDLENQPVAGYAALLVTSLHSLVAHEALSKTAARNLLRDVVRSLAGTQDGWRLKKYFNNAAGDFDPHATGKGE
jgi:hypothetical protein